MKDRNDSFGSFSTQRQCDCESAMQGMDFAKSRNSPMRGNIWSCHIPAKMLDKVHASAHAVVPA